jgi:4-hydroxybenzoate polyprenyltransferase
MTKLLAYAQLLRLPNVFTALADVLMTACAAGYVLDRWDVTLLLMASSGCLYLSGMVFNDVFDRHGDAVTQAFRPIPSGRVPVKTAVLLGSGLMVCGIAVTPSTDSLMVAFALAAMILAYDGGLKHTPLGPVAMGTCRSLNVLLGLSGDFDAVANPLQWHLVLGVGVYILGVTVFARTEDRTSTKRMLLLGTAAMIIGLILALTLPTWREPDSTWVPYPYLVVAFGVWLSQRIVPAVQSPSPANVQAAVKRCILGLIVLDAVLTTAFVGGPGLLLLLLFVPARLLGRWIYST